MDIFRSVDTDTFFSYDEVAVEDEFERRLFSDRLARIIMDEKGGKPLVVSIVNRIANNDRRGTENTLGTLEINMSASVHRMLKVAVEK